MSENSNKVVKSGLWYTIANISIRAVAIITSPIYTKMLTTGDYALANNYNSWIDIFNILTCLCVVYSIGRAKLDFGEKFDEFMSALQGLSSSFGFVILIIAFLLREKLSAFLGYEVPLVIALFAYLCVSPSVEYMMQKCRYFYRYKENILISLITCISQVALSIILMLCFNDARYIGKILGVIIPTFLMGIVFYIQFLRRGKVFYNKEYWLYALKIGLPMIPHALALVVLAQTDRLMIKQYIGNSESGLYTFGYTYATLLMIFTNAIGQAWLPWFNDQLFEGSEKSRDSIRNIQKKLVMLGCVLSFVFIVFAPEALMILSPASPDYWQAKYIVPPVVLGTLAQYFYTNYVNVEIFYKRTPIIAIGSVSAAIVNFILNMIAIPRFGYEAAAYTTLISYIFLMILHYVCVRFVLKERVYDSAYMFISLAVMVSLGLSFMLLYDFDAKMIALRYILAVVIIGIFAIFKRRDIITLVIYVKKNILKKE